MTIINYHVGLGDAQGVGGRGIITKHAIINYHHRTAAARMGWGGVSLTKDQFVMALRDR